MNGPTDGFTRQALQAAVPAAPERLRALHRRLATAARRARLVDVAYRSLDSPLGKLLLAATEQGLVRVAFASEDPDAVLQSLADGIGPRVLEDPSRLDPVARALEAYFAGRRRRFELALDWRLARGFRRTVLRHLAVDVPYGQTATYAQLAKRAGNPGAVRAVGTTCALNPLPIVVPCHRIVRTDGGLGGYRGGVRNKQRLLRLERGQVAS